MFKFISKKLKKNNKGFTLAELIVVLAILGIIGAIAVPRFTVTRKNAAITAHNANVKTLKNAASLYYVENGVENGSEVQWTGGDNESWKNYLQDWPQIPEGLTEKDLNIGEKGDKKVTNNEYTYKVEIKQDGTVEVTIEKQSD